MAAVKRADTPEQSPAPVALGRAAQSERIGKSARIFADVPNIPRVALPDGSVGAVQREVRADGTHGPLVGAFIRPSTDGRESAQRAALAPWQSLSDALYTAHGVQLFAPPEPPAE